MKTFFKNTILYRLAGGAGRAYFEERQFKQWVRSGKPAPAPHIVKQRTIRDFAQRFGLKVFVETGTYLGDMVFAVKEIFDEIYSIELDEELSRKASDRFKNDPHIAILSGNSGEVLKEVLLKINRPCLFWLDGHYSAGVGARGEEDTPVRQELIQIFQHPQKLHHVILVDDARLFTGDAGYPELEEMIELTTSEGFNQFDNKDDIIQIFKTAT